MVKKNKFRTKKTGEKGFTLIEIIAVLVILGILAAVAIPKFSNLQQEAQKKSALALIAATQSGLALKYSEELLKNNGNSNATWTTLTTMISSDNDCKNFIKTDGYDGFTCSLTPQTNYITIMVTTPENDSVTGNFTNPAG